MGFVLVFLGINNSMVSIFLRMFLKCKSLGEDKLLNSFKMVDNAVF